MTKKPEIIVVIPMYNEAERVTGVINKALKHTDRVIVVDDCSNDSSFETARKTNALVLKNNINRGAGFTTRVGCDRALDMGADIIITMDADGQHDPNDIPRLVDILVSKNLDIVFGSRKRDKNMPFTKRLGNRLLSGFARIIFWINISDSQTGFHAFTSQAYPKLRWESDRYGVVSEFIMRVSKNKLKYREVPVKTIYVDKEIGMTKTDAFKSLMQMIKWRLRG